MISPLLKYTEREISIEIKIEEGHKKVEEKRKKQKENRYEVR